MKFKERLGEAFRLYFILVTLISIMLMILGLTFDNERSLGYEVFMSPLIYAAIGVIPCLFVNPSKEVSMKKLLLTRFFQLALVEVAVLILAFSADSIPTEKKGVVIGIAVGIVIVFILSNIVEYIFELSQAKALNASLEKYQQSR